MKIDFNKIYAYLKDNYKRILFNVLFLFIVFFICFYDFPYVIYRPGGVLNISDRITIENQTTQKGTYNMCYVTVAKGNFPNILMSYVMKDWDLKKEEDVVINGSDYDTTIAIEKIDMQNSLETAKKVAFEKAGYNVKLKGREGYIVSIDENAKTNLKVLDQIISIDGKVYTDIVDFKGYINSLNIGDKVSIRVKNNDKVYERYATIYEYENRKVIGIVVLDKNEYETPKEMEFKNRASEAGSSGGLMLSLSIYDALEKEDLTKGRKVVGTGTIDINGNVGEIGGVKYKLLGAEKDNADIFFVPKGNYEEAINVYNDYKLSFDLVMVNTMDDAISYLKK